MAKAYDRARTREFTPSCDKDLPEAERTVFILGWLSVFDFTAIEEAFAGTSEARAFPKLIEVVRHSLRGWKNFPMPDGKEAPFIKGDDGVASKETVAFIGPRELMEIAANCDGQERLAPDDVGKS